MFFHDRDLKVKGLNPRSNISFCDFSETARPIFFKFGPYMQIRETDENFVFHDRDIKVKGQKSQHQIFHFVISQRRLDRFFSNLDRRCR